MTRKFISFQIFFLQVVLPFNFPRIFLSVNYLILVFLKRPLPGQDSSSLEAPGHEAPLLSGAGLLHSLVLFFFPFLHELQDPHILQAPSTRKYFFACMLQGKTS